jgi:hypothetical protein
MTCCFAACTNHLNKGGRKNPGIDTDLVIYESIPSLIHEVRRNPNIVFVSHVAYGSNAVQYRSKLALDPTESARKVSVQDKTRQSQVTNINGSAC